MIVLGNVVVPADGVRLVQSQVAVHIEDRSGGEGTLTVAESSVTWISQDSNQGFSLTFPSIVLHAISRDRTAFREECIYVLVDASKADLNVEPDVEPNAGGANDEGDDEEEGGGQHVVIRFVPADKTCLPIIYQQMCECQELNPEDDDFSDNDESYENGNPVTEETITGMQHGVGDGQFFTEVSDDIQLNEEGRDNLLRIMAASEAHQNHDGNCEAEDEEMKED